MRNRETFRPRFGSRAKDETINDFSQRVSQLPERVLTASAELGLVVLLRPSFA
jgi:hypothetical protein